VTWGVTSQTEWASNENALDALITFAALSDRQDSRDVQIVDSYNYKQYINSIPLLNRPRRALSHKYNTIQ